MSHRFQFTIASVGGDLREQRDWVSRAVTIAGHIPVDLTSAGILDQAPTETVARHVARTDYLMLLIDADADIERAAFDSIGAAYNVAVRDGVPVLCFVRGRIDASRSGTPSALEQFAEKLEINPVASLQPLPKTGASVSESVVQLIDTYQRPGWVSARALPGDAVAEELARLGRENAELRERIGESDPADERRARRESVTRLLHANQIVIQLWERAASEWEKPIEMSLYDFFARMGPELVVEKSAADANQFIPIGVCELDPTQTDSGWLVPPHTLNLWFTDLMALGLVEPSTRKHGSKDPNQYWSLTVMGRELLSGIRQKALATGGHRNLGMTQEFPVVTRLP